LVEHLVYTEEARGSSPLPPTKTPGAIARGRRALALALLGSFLFTHFALAQGAPMRFRLARVEGSHCAADCPRIIVAEGVIEQQTPQAFVDFVKTAAEERGARGVVLLSSPGGRVVASMELGAELRKMRAAVIVARSLREGGRDLTAAGQCMSACVYAMMGGIKRIVPPESRVGIHRMSREDAVGTGRGARPMTRSFASDDMVGALADYAAQMGVSREVILTAEHISPDQIHILTAEELWRWRLASQQF
jgi:hypothetical protein